MKRKMRLMLLLSATILLFASCKDSIAVIPSNEQSEITDNSSSHENNPEISEGTDTQSNQ